MSVEGRTAIVTGAATGIGRATARVLAERGARVVAAGLQPDELAGTVQAIADAGGEAIAVDADVSDPDAIEAVAAAAETAFGGTDILVNNAAVYPLGPWHEMDAAALDAVFATNVRGYYLMARAVREQMIARGGGSVVNVASVTFWTGNALLAAYVASKGAGPASRASARVRPMTAPLEATYAARSALPVQKVTDDTLTTDPPPRAIICSRTARAMR